jgi:hypothetical protein
MIVILMVPFSLNSQGLIIRKKNHIAILRPKQMGSRRDTQEEDQYYPDGRNVQLCLGMRSWWSATATASVRLDTWSLERILLT